MIYARQDSLVLPGHAHGHGLYGRHVANGQRFKASHQAYDFAQQQSHEPGSDGDITNMKKLANLARGGSIKYQG